MKGKINVAVIGTSINPIITRIRACLNPAEALPELSFPVTIPVKKIWSIRGGRMSVTTWEKGRLW